MDILEVVETTVMNDSVQMLVSCIVILSVILFALGAIAGMSFDAEDFGRILMALSIIVAIGAVLYTKTLDTEPQYKAFVSDEKVIEEKGYIILEQLEDDVYLLEKEK